ncbi:MAG: hypothetical protein RBU28_05730 [Bacteroidales bacterium]|jgi:hypothetical protein|nr:hypothetical protein [Bacteroidales bacterium]
MKKRIAFLTGLLLILFIQGLNAQKKNDYFAGNWNLTVFETPYGDLNMVASLVRKDGILTGVVKMGQDGQDQTINIESIDEPEGFVIMYFVAQGYEVSIMLAGKDENNVVGSMLGMFNVTGVRDLKKKQ